MTSCLVTLLSTNTFYERTYASLWCSLSSGGLLPVQTGLGEPVIMANVCRRYPVLYNRRVFDARCKHVWSYPVLCNHPVFKCSTRTLTFSILGDPVVKLCDTHLWVYLIQCMGRGCLSWCSTGMGWIRGKSKRLWRCKLYIRQKISSLWVNKCSVLKKTTTLCVCWYLLREPDFFFLMWTQQLSAQLR